MSGIALELADDYVCECRVLARKCDCASVCVCVCACVCERVCVHMCVRVGCVRVHMAGTPPLNSHAVYELASAVH